MNRTGVERVLPPPQDDLFQRFTDVGEQMLGRTGGLQWIRVFIGDRDITEIVRTQVEEIGEERDGAQRAVLAAQVLT